MIKYHIIVKTDQLFQLNIETRKALFDLYSKKTLKDLA